MCFKHSEDAETTTVLASLRRDQEATMRTHSVPAVLAFSCCLAAGTAWADGGLTVSADEVPWPKFQARVSLTTTTPLSTDLTSSSTLQGGRVLGDYYFSSGPLLGSPRLTGGFRATSGLLFNSRGASLSLPTVPRGAGTVSLSQQGLSASADAPDGSHTVPYVGVGYTGLSVKGGWGFTADVGLMAVGSGSGLRPRGQTFDDVVRDLRITPVLQLGLSYSF
jgi:hypothetical protein